MSLTSFKEFDKLFEDFDFFMRPRWPIKSTSRRDYKEILCDVKETPDKFLVSAELPGIRKDQIKLSLHEGVLEISGEHKQEKEEKDEVHHLVERSYGKFSRRIQLPDAVDPSKVHAEYKDGVLYVNIPKSEKAKPVDVKIN